MMHRRVIALLTIALILLPTHAYTGEPPQTDSDLDRIPIQLSNASGVPVGVEPRPDIKIYIENAMSVTTQGSSPFAPPNQRSSYVLNDLFADGLATVRMDDHLALHFSGRVNVSAGQFDDAVDTHTLRFDDRETYASWQPTDSVFCDVGRINLKSGVASGSNPTDFFRARATVDPLSADPAVLREDRLGVAMARIQRFWDGGGVVLAMAPRLERPIGIEQDDEKALDLMFDRTNSENRLLVKIQTTLAADLSAEILGFSDPEQSAIGFNLTRHIGDRAIGYVEAKAGSMRSLVGDALQFAIYTGDLAGPYWTSLAAGNRAHHLTTDTVVGINVAISNTLTVEAEYHYDGSALERNAWQHLFDNALSPTGPIGLTELDYIQQYALDQGRSASSHTAFVRLAQVDALVRGLELDALTVIDLADGSAFTQASAQYNILNRYTLYSILSFNSGGTRSAFENQGHGVKVFLKIQRYL